MAPFSPSRFLNAPLSSSTPRHLTRNGSPRKRTYPFDDKENTPKRPSHFKSKESRLIETTPKRNVSLVPRTPTPFKVSYIWPPSHGYSWNISESNETSRKATWSPKQHAWCKFGWIVRGKNKYISAIDYGIQRAIFTGILLGSVIYRITKWKKFFIFNLDRFESSTCLEISSKTSTWRRWLWLFQ